MAAGCLYGPVGISGPNTRSTRICPPPAGADAPSISAANSIKATPILATSPSIAPSAPDPFVSLLNRTPADPFHGTIPLVIPCSFADVPDPQRETASVFPPQEKPSCLSNSFTGVPQHAPRHIHQL